MTAFYTNFDGADLDAFQRFLKAEGLKASPGLIRVFREWCRFVAGDPAIPRYSTLSPEQLSLILGEAAEIKRNLTRCELALLEPRPMLPEDLPAWRAEREAVRTTLARIDQWQDGLLRTEKVIATPPPDLATANELARYSYTWGNGPKAGNCRELLFHFLRLFIAIPPPPVTAPKAKDATSSGPQAPTP